MQLSGGLMRNHQIRKRVGRQRRQRHHDQHDHQYGAASAAIVTSLRLLCEHCFHVARRVGFQARQQWLSVIGRQVFEVLLGLLSLLGYLVSLKGILGAPNLNWLLFIDRYKDVVGRTCCRS